MAELRANDLAGLVARYRPEVEAMLRDVIPSDSPVDDMYDMLRYHLGWLDESLAPRRSRGGKLLRPALVLACCEAASGDFRRGLPAAVAVELFHNFSLIHDDVEDRSEERHGRPTVWARWGIPRAVNAGDAMLVLSELSLLQAPAHGIDPALTLTMTRLLNQAYLAVAVGQHLDLTLEGNPDVTREQYFRLIGGKTAALLGCATHLGALSGGAPSTRADHFRQFGEHLGLAFQIQDDVLGIWGDPRATGKPRAGDVYTRKITLPVIEALRRASTAEGERIRSVYRSNAPSDEDVAATIGAFDALRVREAVDAEATASVTRALAELDLAQPEPGSRDDLQMLARSLIGRSA
jgi:geranylgeranyl diphosphate synthase, type I